MDKNGYLQFLKRYLSEKRILHSEGVAETSIRLAKKFGYNEEDAFIAGYLHDVAREIPSEEAIRILKLHSHPFCKEDFFVPEVLHAYLSPILIKENLHLTDEHILQAISRHTTGAENMTPLDAIIFVGDMIEPGRNYPGVQELRAIAEKDLFKALFYGVKHTITYLLDNHKIIHPRSIDTYNWLLKNDLNT